MPAPVPKPPLIVEASAFAVSLGLRGIRGNPRSGNAGRENVDSVEPPPMSGCCGGPTTVSATTTGAVSKCGRNRDNQPPPWPAVAAVLSVEPVFALLAPLFALFEPSGFVVELAKLLALAVLLVEPVYTRTRAAGTTDQ